MKVHVKLYASLQEYAPEGHEPGNFFQVELDGESVLDLVTKLGIKSLQVQIVMVNGERVMELDQILNDDDLVVIFPPIGGC